MTKLERLEQIAEDNGIKIVYCRELMSGAVCGANDDGRVIILNPEILQTEEAREYALRHELAHFIVEEQSGLPIPEYKLERLVDAQVIRDTLPLRSLQAVLVSCNNHTWEVAEVFGVPEYLVVDAIKLYRLAS